MWIQAHHTHIPTDVTSDTTAIKKVCMAETQAAFDHDYKAWASYHVQSADEQLTTNNSDGSFNTTLGWDNFSKAMKSWMAGPKTETPNISWDNFIFTIRGDMAVAAYDMSKQIGNGKITHGREFRSLLRINKQWKIFAVQAYYDNPSGK